jgi:hypothetical protein
LDQSQEAILQFRRFPETWPPVFIIYVRLGDLGTRKVYTHIFTTHKIPSGVVSRVRAVRVRYVPVDVRVLLKFKNYFFLSARTLSDSKIIVVGIKVAPPEIGRYYWRARTQYCRIFKAEADERAHPGTMMQIVARYIPKRHFLQFVGILWVFNAMGASYTRMKSRTRGA